jgi:hypothetical protein
MCPTPVGRIHTRVATIVAPAILGVVLWIITGREDFLVLVGVYLLLGVSLDAGVYSWLIAYQPPWMTFVLALAELGLLYVLAQILELDLRPWEAIVFYWACWILAIWSKLAALPIASLTYLESSGEFRRAAWSIPPAQAPLPVLVSAADASKGAGPLLRSASGEHKTPLEPLPSPSGLHTVPK